MRHRLVRVLVPALLLVLPLTTPGFAQERASRPGSSSGGRPLVKPSVVNGGRRAAEEKPPERGESRRAGLRRSPGKSLEDLRRELERSEAGDRAGGLERARDRVGAGERAGASSSHTRRIVVRNGETIVDEETVDGRPVWPGVRRPDVPGGPRPAARAEARASSSSSHSRRRVVRNGKVVVDEETVDGRPVKPGARPPALDRRMEELLREMERDLLRDLERQGAGDAARELSRELERVRAGARRGRR